MDQNEKIVVVLGDWFIDENWLVANRNVYSSSHTGDVHYLSKHTKIDKRMISLCGATEILEVLRNFFASKELINFIGFGVWSKYDDNLLQCTLCSEYITEKHLTPYTLASLKNPEIKDQRICPYSQQICNFNPNLENLSKTNNQSTNRIIRCYEGYGGGLPHLLSRIDWELPILDINYEKFKKLDGRNVTSVVIEDHGKGVVTSECMEQIIQILKPNLKNINWYIRTKLENPEWMKVLKKEKAKIKLKVVDYKLANYRKGQRRYRYGKHLARTSLEILGELTGDVTYLHGEKISSDNLYSDRAAVLLEDNSAIAKDGDTCYNVPKVESDESLINIGKTTMFFNALIAQDLCDTYKSLNFGQQCFNALRCANEWSKQSTNAWNKEELHFYGDYRIALKPIEEQYLDKKTIEGFPYSEMWEDWNKSSKDIGIFESDNKKVFQLWRGEGSLKKYICVGGPKRSAINDLLKKIDQFVIEKDPKHSFNSLLLSSPGWGKSYLAKSIANHFNMRFETFSLSQMASSMDLVDCFDTICSVQNRTDKRLLIFFDEINCEIEGHHAMGLLLSPIWDGSFVKEGKLFRLRPAVWIFASTGLIKEILSTPNKGSDFLSRINGPIIELDSLVTAGSTLLRSPLSTFKKELIENPDLNPEANETYKSISAIQGQFRTEQVYLGASILYEKHGPISKIQIAVLKLFHDILLVNGIRSLEFFISKFHNIQYGAVYYYNVPSMTEYPELKRHVVLPKYLRLDQQREPDNLTMVDIETIIV